jgi:hypothetical protein
MITLSNAMVLGSAPVGTVVGALTVYDPDGTARQSYLSLTEGSAGFFRLSGNNIITMRTPMAAGVYTVKVRAVAQYVRLSDCANFEIVVTPKASALLGMAADATGELLTEDGGESAAAVSIGE